MSVDIHRMPASVLLPIVNTNYSQFMEKTGVHFQWLKELLAEAKEAFKQPEAALLPKTPGTKRPTRRTQRKRQSTAASELSEELGNGKRKRITRAGRPAVVTMAESGNEAESDVEISAPFPKGKKKKKSSNATAKSPGIWQRGPAATASARQEKIDAVSNTPSKQQGNNVAFAEPPGKSNSTPRRSVADANVTEEPIKQRASIRRSLLTQTEKPVTPKHAAPPLPENVHEQSEPSPAPLLATQKGKNVQSELRNLCSEIVETFPSADTVMETPEVGTSRRRSSRNVVEETDTFPSPPAELEMQEKSMDISLVSNMSATDHDDSTSSKHGKSLRGVARHSISINKSSRRSSILSKSTRQSTSAKLQKAKLSIAAQMVLSDELDVQIEKLQAAIVPPVAITVATNAELFDEEPKHPSPIPTPETDDDVEDVELMCEYKSPPKPVRTKTRAAAKQSNSEKTPTSKKPASPSKEKEPFMRITRTKQRKLDAVEDAAKGQDPEPMGSGLPPKPPVPNRDHGIMHSKLRDIQEKLGKVQRHPVNSPAKTNTSVRSYTSIKTPSPSKRPVIGTAIKGGGGVSSSSKSVSRPIAVLSSIFKQRTTPGNLVNFTNPMASKSLIRTPQKNVQSDLDQQKKADQLKLQEQRQAEATSKKEEMIRLRIEEQKRKRQERAQKVAQSKEQKDREYEEQMKKKMEKQTSNSSLKNDEDKKQKLKTMKEAEQKRRHEEESRKAEAEQRKQREEEEYRRQWHEQTQKQKEKEAELRQQLKEKQRVAAVAAAKAKQQHPTTSAALNKSQLNGTVTMNSSQSYDMTPNPRPKKVAPSTETNYNIDDLNSEDETDDEENPRKKIPRWAEGVHLKSALITQWHEPMEVLDGIFGGMVLPDLSLIFKVQRKRFKNRTSSQFWSSPIWKSTQGLEV